MRDVGAKMERERDRDECRDAKWKQRIEKQTGRLRGEIGKREIEKKRQKDKQIGKMREKEREIETWRWRERKRNYIDRAIEKEREGERERESETT